MTTSAVTVHNESGRHEIVLVCEHASATIPAEFNGLGLDTNAALSHVAWDPGAVTTARHLADRLDAVLVEGAVSRLVYDCNRPPESATAMPAKSEIYPIPGNVELTTTQRQYRIDHYYRPFESRLANVIRQHHCPAILVTVHSFTPVYHGVPREVEIGILHDRDTRLADALLTVASGFNIQRNQPYGSADGVTHTLQQYGIDNGLHNVMIEIRNDLIQTDAQCAAMADHLQQWLLEALALLSANARADAVTGS